MLYLGATLFTALKLLRTVNSASPTYIQLSPLPSHVVFETKQIPESQISYRT